MTKEEKIKDVIDRLDKKYFCRNCGVEIVLVWDCVWAHEKVDHPYRTFGCGDRKLLPTAVPHPSKPKRYFATP